MIVLAATAPNQLLKPAGCGTTNFPCGPHPDSALMVFYLSMYLIAFGNGAGEPSIVTFGTDQFDEEHCIESESKKLYYGYFYVATNLGCLFSETVLSYLENSGHWALGFEISAFIAVVSLVMFFCGTARYRYSRPQHVNEYRSFDQAIVSNSNICTVTQVEKVKCVLRLVPIWLCAVTFNGIFIQMVSLYVEQGSSMKTSIKNFHIPPASMSIFDILFSSLYIVLYKSCIKPLYIKIFKTIPKAPSQLEKTCYGLILAMLSMAVAGIVEIQRKKYAQNNEEELSSLFILWQVPQYLILGFGEALVYVSLNEFFDSQMPHAMKSMGIALSLSSNAVGSYICSLILTVVMKITTKNGGQGWVPANLNDGFLENYFFLVTILSAFELVLFAIVAQSYKPVMEDVEERVMVRHQSKEDCKEMSNFAACDHP